MSNLSSNSYTFDNLARINNDNNYLDERNIQNKNNLNYRLTSYNDNSNFENTVSFALKQPNVFYKSGYSEGGINGSVIEQNNKLKLTTITRPDEKIVLNQRPYLTIPYLGKGIGDPDIELELKTGENISNRKTINEMSEKPNIQHNTYPMIESLKENIQNPDNLIEENAKNGWVRGGEFSRDFARSNHYNQYKK